MKLKLQYDSYLGLNVMPYVNVKKIPRKGETFSVGGVTLEVTAVLETPFSKFQAAIVYVRESQVFFK
jgi:hypothetical protein